MSKFMDYVKTAFWILLVIQIAPPIIKNASRYLYDTVEPKNKVGLIVINSCIMTSNSYCKQLQKFFKNPEIKAILLKIDSPGGAAGSSEAISQEIIKLKKEFPKPIVTYTENLCASGGYQVAAATDYIVATGSAIVGSIGSKITTQFKVQELLAKYDVQTHSISSGTFKNTLDPFVPMTEDQEKMLQSVVDNSYQQFTTDVAKYRHININQKSTWADGKIFTGQEALNLRLVDEIGNQSSALMYIKKHILHEDREIELIKTQSPSRLEQLLYPEHDEDDDNMQMRLQTSLEKFLSQMHMWNLGKQFIMH